MSHMSSSILPGYSFAFPADHPASGPAQVDYWHVLDRVMLALGYIMHVIFKITFVKEVDDESSRSSADK